MHRRMLPIGYTRPTPPLETRPEPHRTAVRDVALCRDGRTAVVCTVLPPEILCGCKVRSGSGGVRV
jgi:hypothetical protein